MSRRTQQVADAIHRVLSEAVQYELKDPRIGFATVVGVDVSADLHHARVRVSVMGDEGQQAETMRGIQQARGFLRRQVAEALNHMRFIPDLHFVLDTSLDYSMRINDVLREIEQERRENPPKLDDE